MMVKKSLFVSVFAALFTAVALAGAAWATPSTQVWIPSTDTQPFGTVHLGVDNYTTVFKKREDGAWASPTIMGLTVGLADTSNIGAEFGVDLKEPADEPWYFNAKIQIKEDSVFEYFPAIAIGGYDFGTKDKMTNYNIGYLLVAKTIPILGRLSAGYYVGNEDLLKDANGSSENDGFLASFDRTLAEIDDRLWIAVDYMSGNNVYGALSFGLSWRFSPNISALVGYDIYNDTKVAGENTITIQFDIDF